MEGQVQQFVTLRFGDLWLDVPIGPIVTSLSKSWKTTAASPVLPGQEEVTSSQMEGFTPVLSKSAKRKMRAARKDVAQSSAKGVTHANVTSTPVSIMKGRIVEVGKSTRQQSKNKGKKAVFEKSEFPPLVYKGKEKMVETPRCKLPGKRGNVAVILPSASSSTGRPTNARNILRADAPEFVPSLAHKPNGECSTTMQKCSLEWKGACLTSRDHKIGHINPKSTLPVPLLEEPSVRESFEASFDPVRHQQRQRNARRCWVDLPAAVDQGAASRHSSHVSTSVKGRWKNTRPKMRVQNPDDSYVTRCICQTLRSLLPGASKMMRVVPSCSRRRPWPDDPSTKNSFSNILNVKSMWTKFLVSVKMGGTQRKRKSSTSKVRVKQNTRGRACFIKSGQPG